jgi:hypothetical protein
MCGFLPKIITNIFKEKNQSVVDLRVYTIDYRSGLFIFPFFINKIHSNNFFETIKIIVHNQWW